MKKNFVIFFCILGAHSWGLSADVSRNLLRIEPKEVIYSLLQLDVEKLKAKTGLTIVTFDIDGTLAEYKHVHTQLPGESLEFYLGEINKKFDLGTDMLNEFASWLNTNEKNFEIRLSEESGPTLIENLYFNNVVVLGLTARKPSIAQKTSDDLKGLGIDFAKTSHIPTWYGPIKNIGDQQVILKNGIVYTGNHVEKAAILPAVADIIAHQKGYIGPITMIHIDDNDLEIAAFTRDLIELYKLDYMLTIRPILDECHKTYLNALCENPDLGKLIYGSLISSYEEFLQTKNTTKHQQ